MNRSEALAPLREPNFRWYFYSRLVSLVGNTMAPIALAFAVLDVSDSASSLGAVLAAHSVPMVIFLLAGGVIADRFGRAVVIQTSNILAGLSQGAIALLILSSTAQLWHLVVLSALNGTVAAVSMPAMAASGAQLVPREQLQPANVLLSMSRAGLAILGPSVAATLVVTAGPGWALAVDALTWFAAAAFLMRVRLSARTRGQTTRPPCSPTFARVGSTSRGPPGCGWWSWPSPS